MPPAPRPSCRREELDYYQDKQRNECFVCGLARNTFEWKDLDFDKHIREDHDIGAWRTRLRRSTPDPPPATPPAAPAAFSAALTADLDNVLR